eukprot:14496_6
MSSSVHIKSIGRRCTKNRRAFPFGFIPTLLSMMAIKMLSMAWISRKETSSTTSFGRLRATNLNLIISNKTQIC